MGDIMLKRTITGEIVEFTPEEREQRLLETTTSKFYAPSVPERDILFAEFILEQLGEG
jgi:hypothetical protein